MADKPINAFNHLLFSIQSACTKLSIFSCIWSAAVAWYDNRFTDDQFHQLVGASLEQIKFLEKKH